MAFEVRSEQYEKLRESVIEQFVGRMVAHVRTYFPQDFASLGEQETRILVRHGIERAESYEIVSERDVCTYVDLMVALGPDFDVDERYPWAADILTDRTWPHPTAKIEALHARAIASLRESAPAA